MSIYVQYVILMAVLFAIFTGWVFRPVQQAPAPRSTKEITLPTKFVVVDSMGRTLEEFGSAKAAYQYSTWYMKHYYDTCTVQPV